MTPPFRSNAETPLRALTAALVLAFGLHAPGALAGAGAGLDDSLPFGPGAVVEAADDALLDELRGRWSGPNGVVGIGIDLRSIWDTGTGSTLSAGISLQADQDAIARRTPIVTSSASVTDGATVRGSGTATADRRVVGDDPTIRVAGLGQLVQLAGDRNRASNELDIGFAPQAGGTSGSTAISAADASSLATGRDGSTASASTAGGAFVIDLVVPGTGRVTQRLGAIDEAPGIKQSIRIAGDDQAIRNIATLRLTLAPLGQRAMIDGAVLRALSSMSGLRR